MGKSARGSYGDRAGLANSRPSTRARLCPYIRFRVAGWFPRAGGCLDDYRNSAGRRNRGAMCRLRLGDPGTTENISISSTPAGATAELSGLDNPTSCVTPCVAVAKRQCRHYRDGQQGRVRVAGDSVDQGGFRNRRGARSPGRPCHRDPAAHRNASHGQAAAAEAATVAAELIPGPGKNLDGPENGLTTEGEIAVDHSRCPAL